MWEHPHTTTPFTDQQSTHTRVNSTWLHITGSSHIYAALLYSSLANHILLLISTTLVFIQRSTTNQIQLLFADQSALTAAATSLGSAHLDLV
jgi:hypothetical protein